HTRRARPLPAGGIHRYRSAGAVHGEARSASLPANGAAASRLSPPMRQAEHSATAARSEPGTKARDHLRIFTILARRAAQVGSVRERAFQHYADIGCETARELVANSQGCFQ